MGETTDSIRRDINRERNELEENLDGIEAKVKETTAQVQNKIEDVQHQVHDRVEDVQEKFREATDWRTQFDRRPLVGLAVAFGGGVLLASMMGGGSKDRVRTHSSHGGSYGGYQPQYQSLGSYQGGGMDVGKQHMSSTFDNVKGALMGVAAAQLKNVLSDALPGFDDEYRQVENEKGSSHSSRRSSQAQSVTPNASTKP